MTDRMTPEQRHRCMSHIHGKDTKPEMIVRRWLWEHGYRYRLHVRKLPGSPDIVMRKYKVVVFVNGCFWHGHNASQQPNGEITDSKCCKIPHSNRRFWLDKINRNMNRDIINAARLEQDGWRIITVWECDLRPRRRQQTLDDLLRQLPGTTFRPIIYTTPEDETALAAEPEAIYSATPPVPQNSSTT